MNKRGYYLKKKNFKVILLEKSARCGGLVQSATDRNHLLEIGPNAFLKSYKNTYDFICEVGLADQIISNRPEAYHRYIFRNGKIHPLPEDPISFFKSDLLSFAAKCRLFLEPFVLKGPSEESIKDFGNRRFGQEVTEVILDAMVKGICTGDISQLDINSMFPKLKDIEKNYRSLLLFLLFFKKRNVQKTNDGKKTFFLSLKKGMGDLSHHVHNKYRAEIQTECLVTQISKEDAGYQVYTEKGIFYAKEVVLATRAMEAAKCARYEGIEPGARFQPVVFENTGAAGERAASVLKTIAVSMQQHAAEIGMTLELWRAAQIVQQRVAVALHRGNWRMIAKVVMRARSAAVRGGPGGLPRAQL